MRNVLIQVAEFLEPLILALGYTALFVLAAFAAVIIGLLLKMSWNQRRAEKALIRRGGRRPLDEIVSELQGREYSLVSLWNESITCMKVPEIWIFPLDVGEQWEQEHRDFRGTTSAMQSLKRTIALFRDTCMDQQEWILETDEEIMRSMCPGDGCFSKSLDIIEEQIGYPAVRKLDYGGVNVDLREWSDEENQSG
ncbi:hypothetical protein [uncultured Gimesia sp.]|uniref:hypothetical protein n=1 Tax=uncultured Gimesia sp. TaxID=1678688 RepID=UPI0030DD86BE|tara:strand:+ start:42452 stop:43036 length:585 start_codon:yes stop_codon:yes gene_type:complete